MRLFVGVHFVPCLEIVFGVDAFHVVDAANVAIARDAFIVGTQIGLDASAFAAGLYD